MTGPFLVKLLVGMHRSSAAAATCLLQLVTAQPSGSLLAAVLDISVTGSTLRMAACIWLAAVLPGLLYRLIIWHGLGGQPYSNWSQNRWWSGWLGGVFKEWYEQHRYT
jgi:hypothetical protein